MLSTLTIAEAIDLADKHPEWDLWSFIEEPYQHLSVNDEAEDKNWSVWNTINNEGPSND